MRRGKWICWLALLVCFLLPGAAWPAEVPEVTAEEYRYFLECFASSYGYVDETELSQYSDATLQAMVKDAVEEEMGDYSDELEFMALKRKILDGFRRRNWKNL